MCRPSCRLWLEPLGSCCVGRVRGDLRSGTPGTSGCFEHLAGSAVLPLDACPPSNRQRWLKRVGPWGRVQAQFADFESLPHRLSKRQVRSAKRNAGLVPTHFVNGARCLFVVTAAA
eukprot:6258562-Alexandrium_andersonii.AAC.1